MPFPAAHAFPSNLPAGFRVENVLTGIGLVTDWQFLFPDTAIMTFKNGTVAMAKISGGRWRMLPYPILDLGGRLGRAAGDRGLMTLAIHPQVRTNRFVYFGWVHDDIPVNTLGPKKNRISRFQLDTDFLFINPASERIIFGSCPPGHRWADNDCMYMNGTTHSVGVIRFGRDGMLWATMGEGIIADGPDWTLPPDWPAPMDAGFLGGKLLRLDPNTGNGLRDNPFWNGNPRAAISKVYSVGLRNAFSGDFTQRTTPPYAMIVGDVGWFTWESVKVLTRGNNVGWPCYEGAQIGPCAGRPCIANANQPGCQAFYAGQLPRSRYPPFNPANVIAEWNHNGRSAAAMGGTFFGAGWPAPYTNCFIYADFVSSEVRCRQFDSQVNRAYGEPRLIMRNADQAIRFIKHAQSNCVYFISFCEFCGRYGSIRRMCWNRLPPLVAQPTRTVTMRPRTNTAPVPTAPVGGPNPCNAGVQPAGVPGVAALPAGWNLVNYASQMFNLQPLADGQTPLVVLNNRTNCLTTPGACYIGLDATVGQVQGPNAGQPLQIAGVRFVRGLGTAVTSQVNFYPNRHCVRFTAYVGVDDEPGPNNFPSEFIIRRDNATDPAGRQPIIFNSTDYRLNRAINKGDAPLFVDVNITGTSVISLLGFTYWGNKFSSQAFTHVNWADGEPRAGLEAAFLPRTYITQPDLTITWRVGQTVFFTGYAEDHTKALIPARAYRWELNMIHGQGATFHTHPQVIQLPAGVATSSFVIESHGLSEQQFYYYELKLYATDGCGREGWSSIAIKVQAPAGTGLAANSIYSPGVLKPNTWIGGAVDRVLRRTRRMVRRFLGLGDGAAPASGDIPSDDYPRDAEFLK
ncbi:Sorbosone dehydrogenase-domain-containing protein [Hyaloraphidium curvatum]|nr:Sorbosone dehydrogenase-domain-containing protein [Hyaloraphidium curvatum]